MIFFTCSLYPAEPSFSLPNKSSCSKVSLPCFCRAFANAGALFIESFIASAYVNLPVAAFAERAASLAKDKAWFFNSLFKPNTFAFASICSELNLLIPSLPTPKDALNESFK